MATSKVRSNTRLAVTTMVAVVSLASGCWFQPGFGPRRSGHNPHERGLTSANVATLTEAWSVPLGGGPVLDPVVSKDGVHAVVGDDLHTRNLSDGSNRWSAQVLPPPAPGGRQIVGSPSIRNDQIMVPAHGIPLDSPQPGNGIRRYDTATGAQGPLLNGTARGSLTVNGDVVASTIREDLNLINYISTLSVGDLAVPSRGWTTLLEFGGSDIAPVTTPAVGHDRVLIGRGTAVYAYTRVQPVCQEPFPGLFFCDPIWFRTLGGTPTVPVLSDDEETVFVGDSAGGLWALDADNGSVAWQADLGGGGGAMPQVLAPPTVGDGQVYVTSSDGRIWAFDADGCGSPTCPAAWATATGSPITKQPALAGGVLYVGSDAGTVHAFRASGCGAGLCTPVWDTATGSRITGAPVVANGNLVVGTADGRLIAYRPS